MYELGRGGMLVGVGYLGSFICLFRCLTIVAAAVEENMQIIRAICEGGQ